MKNLFSFLVGIAVNAILCNIAITTIPAPANFALVVSIIAYFGYLGITEPVKIGHKGVATLFGARIPIVINEGRNWLLPRPIMNFVEVDCREKPLNFAVSEALSSEDIPMKVNVSAQIKVVDPYKSLSVEKIEDSLKEVGARSIRWETKKLPALELTKGMEELSERLKKEIDDTSEKNWGIDAKQVFVTDIRLPKDLEDAMTQKKTEEAQKDSERTEFNHILTMLGGDDLEEGKKAWKEMKPKDRATIMQAERGKRTVITVDGGAGDFTKGSVAAAALNKGKGGRK